MLDTARRIATPEGIELELRLAGPVPRAGAWALDFALRLGILLLASMILSALGGFGTGMFLLLWFFLEWLFPAWCEVNWAGATPGKKALKLVVLHDDGTPVRWPAALARNLLRAIDFLPLFYGIGLLAMLMNRDFKRLGDLAAGTVVVYLSEKTGARVFPDAPPVSPPFALSLEEQRAVLELAERASTLTRERLEELAELPSPLVGSLDGSRAAARLIGMANYIAGRK